MSYELTSRVHRMKSLSGVKRWVLLILADMANDQGECWPSVATICQRAGISRASTIRAISWLETHGFLMVNRRPVTGNRHMTNLYYVRVASEEAEPSKPPSTRSKHKVDIQPFRAREPEAEPGDAVHEKDMVSPCDPVDTNLIPTSASSCDPVSTMEIPTRVSCSDPVGITEIPESLINHHIKPLKNPPPLPPYWEEAEEENNKGEIFKLYEQNFGKISPLMAKNLVQAARDYPVEWVEAAMRECVGYNNLSWKYCEAILKRWQRDGFGVDSRKGHTSPAYQESDDFDPMVKEWLERKRSAYGDA